MPQRRVEVGLSQQSRLHGLWKVLNVRPPSGPWVVWRPRRAFNVTPGLDRGGHRGRPVLGVVVAVDDVSHGTTIGRDVAVEVPCIT